MSSPTPFTVSQLNRQIRTWLEQDIGEIAVIGELSNVSKPASGHIYFTLKDTQAQIRCVYFKMHHSIKLELTHGIQVTVQGRLSLYEPRGDYQLIVTKLAMIGNGDLYQQFEMLKAKLLQLGLFEVAHKKPLPLYPRTIGIITSPTGAAIQDILTTLKNRYPLAQVLIYPCEVQGKLAAAQLTQAIVEANQHKRCDVLILARGGGSMEDLFAFNDEALAHAIFQSNLPIISGVGHETDFTIADFVADHRAATPTAAAQAATPNGADILEQLTHLMIRMSTQIKQNIHNASIRVQHQLDKLASPLQYIASSWQTLDFLNMRLHHCLMPIHIRKKQELLLLMTRLTAIDPSASMEKKREYIQTLKSRLTQAVKHHLLVANQQYGELMATIKVISPLATLERGYSITYLEDHVLFDADSVQIKDRIKIQLHKGQLVSTVVEIEKTDG